MPFGLKQLEHFEFTLSFPPQFLHDSSGNFFQYNLSKFEYKKHEEVVHSKAQ